MDSNLEQSRPISTDLVQSRIISVSSDDSNLGQCRPISSNLVQSRTILFSSGDSYFEQSRHISCNLEHSHLISHILALSFDPYLEQSQPISSNLVQSRAISPAGVSSIHAPTYLFRMPGRFRQQYLDHLISFMCALISALLAHKLYSSRPLWYYKRIPMRSLMIRLTINLPSRILLCDRIATLLLLACTICAVNAADDQGASSRPPVFDGTRHTFLPWFMAFSGFVAWRLSDCSDILNGKELRPVIPNGTSNQNAVAEAEASRLDWDRRNRKLYGLLLQCVPDWLRTSLYNAHTDDGRGAVIHLQDSFDINDANDHAACISRLQQAYIDSSRDINEEDLRLQFDSMQTAVAGIRRSSHAPPPEATLQAMFDNSLPISYSQIRQLVRRSAHTTFLSHYADYVAQVRAELASRRPVANAFVAGLTDRNLRTGPVSDPNANASTNSKQVCLRCGKDGHIRFKCPRRQKVVCKHCGADHLSEFCVQSTDATARNRLTKGAQHIIQRDHANKKNERKSEDSRKHATTPAAFSGRVTDTDQAQAIAQAATMHIDDPETRTHAYAEALQWSMGNPKGHCAILGKRNSPSPTL